MDAGSLLLDYEMSFDDGGCGAFCCIGAVPHTCRVGCYTSLAIGSVNQSNLLFCPWSFSA
jgi:hypothetical protein